MPQPEMRQAKLRMEVGESRPTTSGATLLGAMMENKKSQRALQNAVSNAGARKHYRTKSVWHCTGAECQAEVKKLMRNASGDVPAAFLIVPFLALAVLGAIFGEGDETSTTSSTAQVATQMQAQVVASEPSPTFIYNDNSLEPAETDETARTDLTLTLVEMERLEAEFRGAQAQSRVLLQRKLLELGLYRGEIDGLFGAGTRTALVEAAQQAKQNDHQLMLESSASVRGLFDMIVLGQL